jgi:hypothetical protein
MIVLNMLALARALPSVRIHVCVRARVCLYTL